MPLKTAFTKPLMRLFSAASLAVFALSSGAEAESLTAEEFVAFDTSQARLGQLLFYDKLLSGNLNISCATCHHHDLHGADGLSLGIGEGGFGLGAERRSGTIGTTRIGHRIPRNAPALWNAGFAEMQNLFHDGRVAVNPDHPSGFDTPAGDLTPVGLNSILAAQALFPMSSAAEMAGGPEDNELGAAFADRIDKGWSLVAQRVREKPAYETAFLLAFPHVKDADDITIVEIVNSLAAFIGTEWQSFDSPYDNYVNHGTPLDPLAERGRELFFGDAGCVSCHNGPMFSDQDFHAVGLPQFGPGRPFDGDTLPRDLGRMETTRDPADAYRFRTPSLRNVALTGPYGHNGAYTDLRDMIRHMCDPVTMRANWTPGMARLPDVPWLTEEDFTLILHSEEQHRQATTLDLTPVDMVEGDIDALEAFLHSLTGETALQRPLGRPGWVPSGLPVD